MDLNTYQDLASRTANDTLDTRDEILNYTLGLGGEAGEFQEVVKKAAFHGHELDEDKAVKELGDVLWYVSQLARMLGVDLEEVAEQNIEKLKKRYPEKFTTEDSIARVDV